MSEFQQKVFEIVKQIPAGTVCTYKDVATALDNPGAARAVGTALSNNPYTAANGCQEKEIVPCHRVVNVRGEMCGFFKDGTPSGLSIKEALLRSEGVKFKGEGKVDMKSSATKI